MPGQLLGVPPHGAQQPQPVGQQQAPLPVLLRGLLRLQLAHPLPQGPGRALVLQAQVIQRQRLYMSMYYGQNMSMDAIAKQLGVNKSTVSRTLKRGRQRLYRCLRYGAAALLEEADSL